MIAVVAMADFEGMTWHYARRGYRLVKGQISGEQPQEIVRRLELMGRGIARSGGRATAVLQRPAEKTGADVLVTDGLTAARGPSDFRDYEPLSGRPGLFLSLAETAPTPEAVQEFASRYGLLWDRFGQHATAKESEEQLPVSIRGEACSDWTRAIEDIREAVHMWALARESNTGALHAFLGTHELRSEAPRRASADMSIDDAWHYLRGEVNSKLLACEPSLVVTDEVFQTMRLTVQPTCLLAALWLQLAIAMEKNQEFKRCSNDGCWNWLEVRATQGRVAREFCSDACRVQMRRSREGASKRRKAKALPGLRRPLVTSRMFAQESPT